MQSYGLCTHVSHPLVLQLLDAFANLEILSRCWSSPFPLRFLFSDSIILQLVASANYKTFMVTKGGAYAETRTKASADITVDMMLDGSWKTAKFKPYNFDALGLVCGVCVVSHVLMQSAMFRANSKAQSFPLCRYLILTQLILLLVCFQLVALGISLIVAQPRSLYSVFSRVEFGNPYDCWTASFPCWCVLKSRPRKIGKAADAPPVDAVVVVSGTGSDSSNYKFSSIQSV